MKACQTRFIVVTGGVLSGLGKGIVTASIGRFFCEKFKIVPIKCDGYLNVDPGTMNPTEHGEVFVLEDGGEVDMDFGHYERFMNINCKSEWNLTSGKVFKMVIDKERQGKFLGKTVQMIPHVTNEIKSLFYETAKKEKADAMFIEIGGTVGDIENELFIEAVRQMRAEVGEENIIFIHLTYVPVLDSVGEQKTKPTQQSVNQLRERGIQPDIIIGRSNKVLTEKTKEKIALFANLRKEYVISDPDSESVYEIPLVFEKEGLPKTLEKKFGIKLDYDLSRWRKLVKNISSSKIVNIALCGKYTELADSYVSIKEALIHAGALLDCKINLKQIETTNMNENALKELKNFDGIIVPGGFGSRGIEGKINAVKFARENNVPFLGLCLGMQVAVVEFARNIGIKDANTTEVDGKTKNPVIDILPEQKKILKEGNYGASMRLGGCKASLKEGSVVQKLYGSKTVLERHRHRYEVNPKYHSILQKAGMVFSGMSPDKRLVEFIELPEKKFFAATQAHPEFLSRFERPHPLFVGFVKACMKK